MFSKRYSRNLRRRIKKSKISKILFLEPQFKKKKKNLGNVEKIKKHHFLMAFGSFFFFITNFEILVSKKKFCHSFWHVKPFTIKFLKYLQIKFQKSG